MKYYIALFLFLCACSTENGKEFLQVDEQSIEKRNFVDTLQLVQSKRFSDFGIENSADFVGSQNELFIIVSGLHEILVIDKNAFDIKKKLSIPEGRGPGEIEQLSRIDVEGDKLLISDSNSQRIILYDTSGTYLKDIYLDNKSFDAVKLLDEDKLLVISTVGSPEYSIIDVQGKILVEDPIHLEKRNPLYLTGKYSLDKGNVYFGGYSESIFKKFQIDEGINQVYSRTFIENISSEGNYLTRKSGDQTLWSFTPEARYSSFDIGIFKNLLVDIPAHNGDEEKKIIDFYSEKDGNYLFSANTLHHPSRIEPDGKYLYLTEYIRGESPGYIFTKYKIK